MEVVRAKSRFQVFASVGGEVVASGVEGPGPAGAGAADGIVLVVVVAALVGDHFECHDVS